jgi:hypothetical protein
VQLHDYIAFLWRDCKASNLNLLDDAILARLFTETKNRGRFVSELDSPVFVDIREAHQHDQRMGKSAPLGDRVNIERLVLFELVGVANENVFPVPIGRPFKGIFFTGEHDIALNGFCVGFDTFEISQRKLPGEVVEGATEVVYSISNDQRPVVAKLYSLIDAVDHSPLVTVDLSGEGIVYRMRPELFRNTPTERVNVALRPFKFRV